MPSFAFAIMILCAIVAVVFVKLQGDGGLGHATRPGIESQESAENKSLAPQPAITTPEEPPQQTESPKVMYGPDGPTTGIPGDED
ncbi:MAG: hypothetical protein AAF603_00225 [Pseudomonadota bacterium]